MSQIANYKLPIATTIGGLSVNLNHLKRLEHHKERCECRSDKITSVETTQTAVDTKLSGIETKQNNQGKKMNLINGVVLGMADKIKQMDARIGQLERQSIKNCVVLSGFHGDENKTMCIEQIEAFFEKELNAPVEVDDIYYIGDAIPKPIVITLATLADKRLIMDNKTKLKDISNKDGKGYFVNKFRSAEANEKRRKERDIYTKNKNSVAHNVEMSSSEESKMRYTRRRSKSHNIEKYYS